MYVCVFCGSLTPVNADVRFRVLIFAIFFRRQGKRVSSVMEGGQEVLKRESMGRRFKGELRDLVERIHSTEVRDDAPILFYYFSLSAKREGSRVSVECFLG